MRKTRPSQAGIPRRFALRGLHELRATTRHPWIYWAKLAAASVFVVAVSVLLAAVVPLGITARLAIVGSGLAVVATLVGRFAPRRRAPLQESAHQLVVDDLGIALVRATGKLERLLRFRPSFGMTILTSARQDHIALAVTSPERAVCIGARLDTQDRDRFEAMLAQAVTMAGDDLIQAAVLPDGELLLLDADSLLQLVALLEALDRTAHDRCYLSDAEGAPVVLDGATFRARRQVFLLNQPFEWRASVFHECVGSANAVFQATWLRQGASEVVLVALVGDDVRRSISSLQDELPELVARDARLAESPPGPPPPHDKRVAIERLFMLPLRTVFDSASCVGRRSVPGDASAP